MVTIKPQDLEKMSPDMMKKVAVALAKSAKQTKQASQGADAALKSLSKAKLAMKSGQKAIKDFED